jgi:hypothetical protein
MYYENPHGLFKIEELPAGQTGYTAQVKDPKTGDMAALNVIPELGTGAFNITGQGADGTSYTGQMSKTADGFGWMTQVTGLGKDGTGYTLTLENNGASIKFKQEIKDGQNGDTKTESGSFEYTLDKGMIKMHGEHTGEGGDTESKEEGFLLPGPDFFKIPEKDIGKWKDGFGGAETTTSPLILDLDGDGVETISTTAGVHFDHDKNGFSESTGWVGKDDGLLVLDRDGNGEIDSGSELFGNKTTVSSGQKAANGFLALDEFDENNDGVFDSRDGKFSELNVWVDRDSNGAVDAGELLTLSQAGVAAINLSYSEPGKLDANGNVPRNVIDSNGNEHRQLGTYIRADGSSGAIEDVWFGVNGTDTIDNSKIEV